VQVETIRNNPLQAMKVADEAQIPPLLLVLNFAQL
jgi:hypothetical protein